LNGIRARFVPDHRLREKKRDGEKERKRKGRRGRGTSELRESRATGSGIFVAPLFECSRDDRGNITVKRSSLRESSSLSLPYRGGDHDDM